MPGGPNGMPNIKPQSATCKASDLSTALSLQAPKYLSNEFGGQGGLYLGVLRQLLVVLEDQEVPRSNLRLLHTKYVFNPFKSSLQPIFEMNLRETKREPRKPKHDRFYETDWRVLDEVQCKNFTCTGQMKPWVQSHITIFL